MRLNRHLIFFSSLFIIILTTVACSGKKENKVDEIKTEILKKGNYQHFSFQSKKRGAVDFNAYLPPNWSKINSFQYPLIILLHGQGEDEYTFITALPKDSLNNWINQKIIPEFVLIALRGGKNTNEMQWYTDPNEEMIVSTQDGELRKYCHEMFNTSMESSKISVIGHSRGATGALNFALYFPSKFASVVSSAFVSDYAIERLKQATNQNQPSIIASGIKIKMLIGDKDQYVLNNNRKGSPIMSTYFKQQGILHQFDVIKDKNHRLPNLWEYPTNLNCLIFCANTWKK